MPQASTCALVWALCPTRGAPKHRKSEVSRKEKLKQNTAMQKACVSDSQSTVSKMASDPRDLKDPAGFKLIFSEII